MLPNFLVLGAAKCATTWIFHCLRQHPQVFVPAEKELLFFDKNYHRGIDWYEKKFHPSHGEKAVGEVATKYLCRAAVAERIHTTLPNIRLIASLRNPVDRAYSAYCHHRTINIHQLSFEQAMESYHEEYIESGLYDSQLRRYFQIFPAEQILILIYEDLQNDPLAFVQRIYKFLGVDPIFVPPQIKHRRNRSIRRNVSRGPGLLTRTVVAAMKNSGLRAAVQAAKKIPFVETNLEKYLFNRKTGQMDPATREKLQKIFTSSNRNLSELLNRDLCDLWQ